MIAHNSVFLSFHFILLVNVVKMKSTKKIAPSYYASPIFSERFVKIVSDLKTYNERKLQISDKDRTYLTTAVQTYKDAKSRGEALEKFDEKIEDIKCTCSLIVKTKLVRLANILDWLRCGGSWAEDSQETKELKALKEEAGLMVLMFQSANVKAGKWFMSYFLKILALGTYDESTDNSLGETPFGEDELQSGIANFLQHCKREKYFAKNKTESDLVSGNPNVPTDMFETLRARALFYVPVYACPAIEFVTIEGLYLEPIWNERELLFGEITGSAVEWAPTIKRYAAEVKTTKEYLANRQWISKPFGHLGYHELVRQIITARTYIFLWVLLAIFNREMPEMNAESSDAIRTETAKTFKSISEFVKYTDSFFLDLVTEFEWTMSADTKNFDGIVARLSERVERILVVLNGSNSDASVRVSVHVNEEYSSDMIKAFLQQFGNYIKLLERKLTPLQFALALSLLVEGN